MAEQSMFWTTGTSGDGTTTYDQDRTLQWLRDTFTTDRYDAEGVIAGVGNQLAVSGTSSPISVNTGAAYVYGRFYQNTSAVSLTVPTATAGTTGHRVVLRASWSAQTVRIALKSSADGTSSAPSLTQTAGTTYEISLATLTRTTGGTVTITDARDFAHFGTALVYRRQGGSSSDWSTAGTTSYTPGEVKQQVGAVSLSFSSSNTATATVTFPSAYAAAPNVQLTLFNGASSTNRKCLVTVESVSSTQVVIRGYLTDGSTTSNTMTVWWSAIGE